MIERILDGRHPVSHCHFDLWAQRDVASRVPDQPPRVAAEIRAMDVFVTGPQQSRASERKQPHAIVANMQYSWNPGIAGNSKSLGVESNPQRQRQQLILRAEVRAL